jgi:antitoxin VapB
MPLHIKNEAAAEAERRLARARKLTLTEAVRIACDEALERDNRPQPVD